MDRLPTGSAIDANAACRGGKQKTNGTKREWCPGSLETPDTLRRSGRTETLTGQASHTSSRAKDRNKGQEQREEGKGQKYRGSKWRKGIKPGEVKLLRSQIAVSTADAAQRLMALGNQNLYVRFPAANPDRRRSLECPLETQDKCAPTGRFRPYSVEKPLYMPCALMI